MAMESTYLILAVTFVTCLIVRTTYELLKEAGKVDPENKILFAAIFTTMCTLWVSWFALCALDPYEINAPVFVQLSGLALVVVGVIFAVGGMLQLKGLENIDHLVTSGLFSRLRHPMYTGFGLWIIGWSTYHGAYVSLAIGLIGLANILYWRGLEDSRLLVQYGDVYRQYRETTWF